MAVAVDQLEPPASARDVSPASTADQFTTATLLRCWVREQGPYRREADDLVIDLRASGTTLTAPIRYWSPAGWHRFGAARLGTGTPADSTTVATLLALEVVSGRSAYPHGIADLVGRVADSCGRIARHVAARAAEPVGTTSASRFLESEQALVLGHPLHPTPKSRSGLTVAEADTYSPELRGSFPLYWFAAQRDVVLADSATGRPAEKLMRELVADLDLPSGFVPVPAHPWQAEEVLRRPATKALVDDGTLRPLGGRGETWSPTSSVRTVYRCDATYMLKLSLGLAITNSKRENLHKELRRGVEMARMLEAGLADEISRAHPGFSIVRDPAWIAVQSAEGAETGLEVAVRDNPFGPRDRVHCLAGLVSERPDRGGGSHLGAILHDLADRNGDTAAEVGAEWFRRYLEAVPAAVLWLYAEHGIGLEAHQQNTLVELDAAGWPVGGHYRDNQGYYYDRARADELGRWVEHVGIESDSRCDAELIDERLGYYLGVNNLIGLIGAMGSQGLADEGELLRAARALLRRVESQYAPSPALARSLLRSETLPCKANLLTRLEGMDELTSPLATQSVYRPLANPIATVA